MTARIAILFHEKNRGWRVPYTIDLLAEFWKQDGLEVTEIYGVDTFTPADVLIVHVDLSVVPNKYLEFARQYPVALNAGLADVRKSSYSRYLVTAGDGYQGPVIVKSNLNFAGVPERLLSQSGIPRQVVRLRKWLGHHGLLPDVSPFQAPMDYPIFPSLQDVPRKFRDNPQVIIEQFLPQIEDGLYHVFNFHFLGDRLTCARLSSPQPIVNGKTQIHSESVEPHPQIIELRQKMNFDYGKFDYVVRDGQVIFPDRQLMLLARDVLARCPGATILYDVKCSQRLADEIRAAGGVPLMWKT
ncbi:MAG TPA: hypothetical protein PKZ53_08790, partial [Acidobacteriota bacterium]|nr:hypothetical protein [Acidobacteriota bacterium]